MGRVGYNPGFPDYNPALAAFWQESGRNPAIIANNSHNNLASQTVISNPEGGVGARVRGMWIEMWLRVAEFGIGG